MYIYIYIYVYLAIFFSVLRRFRHLTPDTSGGYNSSSACCLGAIHPGEGRRLLVHWKFGGYKAFQFLEINLGAENPNMKKPHSFLKRWDSKKHGNPMPSYPGDASSNLPRCLPGSPEVVFFFVGINLTPLVAKCQLFFFFGGGEGCNFKERKKLYIYIDSLNREIRMIHILDI